MTGFDIIFRGARLIDGTGGSSRKGDYCESPGS